MIFFAAPLCDGDAGNLPLFKTLLRLEGEFRCFGIRPNRNSMPMAFICVTIPEPGEPFCFWPMLLRLQPPCNAREMISAMDGRSHCLL